MASLIRQQAHTTAGDPQTAAAGTTLLRQGGNCVDAAIAATFAAFITEPVLTGPLGGGFAMLAKPKVAPIAYDFFATVPGLTTTAPLARPTDFQALTVSFGPTTQTFHAGRGAVAVPALVPGLLTLHREHGRLPLAKILAPAIDLCRTGATLSATLAPIAHILTPIIMLTPQAKALLAPKGRVVAAKERFFNQTLAAALHEIAQGNWHFLYENLQKLCAPAPGLITATDINTLQIAQQTPILTPLGDWVVATQPPPSLAGMLVAAGLKLLTTLYQPNWQDETSIYTAFLQTLATTQKLRTALVDKAVGQGQQALQAVADDIAKADHIANLANLTSASKAPTMPSTTGSTTHISCMDEEGGVCAITSSNGEGCGYVVPEVGVMANNFLGEEDINPLGFFAAPAGSKMISMMCPTIVLKNNIPVATLGTGGSNRIRTALLQVIAHHLLGQRSLAAAIYAPRLHYEGDVLYLERSVLGQTLSQATLQALTAGFAAEKVVLFDAPNMFFGGVHAAAWPLGSGDPRRSGTVCAV